MSKHRMRRRDSVIASERQIEPPAHTKSLDRRVNRGWICRNHIHQLLTRSGEDKSVGSAELRDFVQVRARRENRIARDDQGKNRSTRTAEALNLLLKSDDLPASKAEIEGFCSPGAPVLP